MLMARGQSKPPLKNPAIILLLDQSHLGSSPFQGYPGRQSLHQLENLGNQNLVPRFTELRILSQELLTASLLLISCSTLLWQNRFCIGSRYQNRWQTGVSIPLIVPHQMTQAEEWAEILTGIPSRMELSSLIEGPRSFLASGLRQVTEDLLVEGAVEEAFLAGVDEVEHMIVIEAILVPETTADGIGENLEMIGIIIRAGNKVCYTMEIGFSI